MGLISRVSSRTYREIVEMSVDIRDLDPYRRDVIEKKKYRLQPNDTVYDVIVSAHCGYDTATNLVDTKIVKPVQRAYNHLVYENGAQQLAIIFGSTALVHAVGKRLPARLALPIPVVNSQLRLSQLRHVYTAGTLYATCNNFYPVQTRNSIAYTKSKFSDLYSALKANDEGQAELTDSVVSAAESSRGKNIDAATFGENPGQSKPEDNDLYTTRDETK